MSEEDYRLSVAIRPGDPVGFNSMSSMGRWVNYATLGIPSRGLSHIAICARHPQTDALVLFESTTACKRPCLLTGQVVKGVQCQPLKERIREYGGRVWVYPLIRPLCFSESQELTALCVADCGKPYDYVGAVRARNLGLGWFARLVHPRPESLDAYYCSELVASRLRDLKRLIMENVSDWAPNPLGRELYDQHVCYRRKRVKVLLTGEM